MFEPFEPNSQFLHHEPYPKHSPLDPVDMELVRLECANVVKTLVAAENNAVKCDTHVGPAVWSTSKSGAIPMGAAVRRAAESGAIPMGLNEVLQKRINPQ